MMARQLPPVELRFPAAFFLLHPAASHAKVTARR
jgi:hypothetical protein